MAAAVAERHRFPADAPLESRSALALQRRRTRGAGTAVGSDLPDRRFARCHPPARPSQRLRTALAVRRVGPRDADQRRVQHAPRHRRPPRRFPAHRLWLRQHPALHITNRTSHIAHRKLRITHDALRFIPCLPPHRRRIRPRLLRNVGTPPRRPRQLPPARRRAGAIPGRCTGRQPGRHHQPLPRRIPRSLFIRSDAAPR